MKNLVLLALLIGIACQPTKSKQEPTSRSWETVASEDGSKPIARHEAAFVEVGNKFYLLGGRGILPTSIYDVKKGVWTEGAKPPIELHHFQPIVYENKIYVIGALTGGYPTETPTSNMFIYDPEKDSWEIGPEIPKERRRGSTGNVLVGDKVLIACGIKNGHVGDHKKWLDSYSFKTGEWEVLPDAPRARDHFQAILANNKVYLAGGRNSSAPENPFSNTIAEVDVYDIKSQTWNTLEKNLPTKRAGNMAVLFQEDILVIGGESDTQVIAHSEVEGLDIMTGTWKSYPSLNRGRHGSGIAVHERTLYTVSGSGNRGGEPELESLEKF
ncbi:MAG: kelch repeat-containing protein [Balneolaceae bacterium]